MTKSRIYSKRPILLQKTRLLPQKSSENDQILYLLKNPTSYFKTRSTKFLFIQNSPLQLQKMRLLPPTKGCKASCKISKK